MAVKTSVMGLSLGHPCKVLQRTISQAGSQLDLVARVYGTPFQGPFRMPLPVPEGPFRRAPANRSPQIDFDLLPA